MCIKTMRFILFVHGWILVIFVFLNDKNVLFLSYKFLDERCDSLLKMSFFMLFYCFIVKNENEKFKGEHVGEICDFLLSKKEKSCIKPRL